MADYTKQIFDMLGVEPEKEFKLKFMGGDQFIQTKGKYKFDKSLRTFWFNDNIGEWRRDLDAMFLAILNGTAQIVKIPHPTAEEQLAIDYARACGYKWLAKDEDKHVYAYISKPQKNNGHCVWAVNGSSDEDALIIGIDIFFIRWEDEEPYYIGD